MPLISVIMPIYGVSDYLDEAIESILCQTERDFELIIVAEPDDPGKPYERIAEYAERDARVTVIVNDSRLGSSGSRNLAIQRAQGEYLAFMDADDMSGPRRFEVQRMHMELYPNIGAFGIRHSVLNEKGWTLDYFTDPELVKAWAIFGVPLRHPTIMVRTKLLLDNNLFYDEAINYADDSDIEKRMSLHFLMSNIDDGLLFSYRSHSENGTVIYKDEAWAQTKLLIRRHVHDTLGMQLSEEETPLLHVHTSLLQENAETQIAMFRQQEGILLQMLECNAQQGFFDEPALRLAIRHYLRKQFKKLAGEQYHSYAGIPAALRKLYWESSLWELP